MATTRRRKQGMSRRGLVRLGLGLGLASWLPAIQLGFRRPQDDLDPTHPDGLVQALAERHLALWEDEELRAEELARMRRTNAEWDFMGRTFLALGLANLALHQPGAAGRYLAVIDRIIEDTLQVEAERGLYHFLMPYARARSWVEQPPRSVFLDGEIGLVLAAREQLAEELGAPSRWREALAQRHRWIRQRLEVGPLLCAESYPDECWTFCNTTALAALFLAAPLVGDDVSGLIRRWLDQARVHLVEPASGLLVSSFSYEGRVYDGPEGSSLWWSAHNLKLFAPDWAQDQYQRARDRLGRGLLGFGFAREWPAGLENHPDVDSGPIVPLLGASAGSSGLALVGARAFGDERWLAQLVRSLDLAAFPVARGGLRSYAAGNQVGDAVIFYALAQGPLWERAQGQGGVARATPREVML